MRGSWPTWGYRLASRAFGLKTQSGPHFLSVWGWKVVENERKIDPSLPWTKFNVEKNEDFFGYGLAQSCRFVHLLVLLGELW